MVGVPGVGQQSIESKHSHRCVRLPQTCRRYNEANDDRNNVGGGWVALDDIIIIIITIIINK